MKKIILTGGGTAGHVMPHLAIIPELRKKGYDIHYIGGKKGIEREIVSSHMPYYGISAGKLRRYADVKNITDLFRVVKGLRESLTLMRRIKPGIVFSKGGFVTVPVVMAARLCGVRVVIHESDITPGLANRLAIPFAHKVCVSFPETLRAVPGRKGVLTGTPLRPELFAGDKYKGMAYCKFDNDKKPVILFTGGSLGAAAINHCLREALPAVCKKYKVVHLCGKGNLSGVIMPGYVEFEFVGSVLPHLYALADMVVSRAGANTIFEIQALHKPNLLIPLGKKASRGDQILNAASFAAQGFSKVLPENEMNPDSLLDGINALYDERERYVKNMTEHAVSNGVGAVMEVLDL